MKQHFILLVSIATIILSSCTKLESGSSGSYTPTAIGPSSGGGSGSGQADSAGVITAGEWNDLSNWNFFDSIISLQDYAQMPAYWNIHPENRISVLVMNHDSVPLSGITVALNKNGSTVFISKTDNLGKAELWIGLFDSIHVADLSSYQLIVNNGTRTVSPLAYINGINKIILPGTVSDVNKAEIAFAVDATGSMGDELEYLKKELYNVIQRVSNENAALSVSTGAVFYRDVNDEYLTRTSDFSTNIQSTIDFIKAQNADGGGDFPESMEVGLDKAVNALQWSASSKKILFLILDAPPHHTDEVLASLQNSIIKANQKGIKIIPVTASGIDKETEFLMRFIAVSTNGTYVFITDDSGIGDPHLKPTVGPYTVEYLNNLMVRLINKYME